MRREKERKNKLRKKERKKERKKHKVRSHPDILRDGSIHNIFIVTD